MGDEESCAERDKPPRACLVKIGAPATGSGPIGDGRRSRRVNSRSSRGAYGAPAPNVRTLVEDAAVHTRRHEEYGFHGNPLRPVRGRHYGPLASAARYRAPGRGGSAR